MPSCHVLGRQKMGKLMSSLNDAPTQCSSDCLHVALPLDTGGPQMCHRVPVLEQSVLQECGETNTLVGYNSQSRFGWRVGGEEPLEEEHGLRGEEDGKGTVLMWVPLKAEPETGLG